jgi:hypothetical protein
MRRVITGLKARKDEDDELVEQVIEGIEIEPEVLESPEAETTEKTGETEKSVTEEEKTEEESETPTETKEEE